MATAPEEHHGSLLPAARSASVAINVGPGHGALVLYPGERFRGRELEISRADRDDDAGRVHSGVHDRTTQERSVLTAIFGSLPAGDYVVWIDATTRGPVVTVPEGGIAEARVT
jgi:hypothetical protein